MTIGSIGSVPSSPSPFTAKVSETQEDNQEKVVNTILSGIQTNQPTADRSGQPTGQKLNAVA